VGLVDEMYSVLGGAAELAYGMGDIPKPDLVDIIDPFLGT